MHSTNYVTLFRPCIDIHEGRVKQIVGESLHTKRFGKLMENFVAEYDLAYYIDMYKKLGLQNGHIIMLDRSDVTAMACKEALALHPDSYHVGGGITLENADIWLKAGAKKVIVSSAIFSEKEFQLVKLQELSAIVGKEQLVIDLSAVSQPDGYYASIHGWKTITDFKLTKEQLGLASEYASEFLIHAIDREGKKQGADFTLITLLKECSPIPVAYAGGIASFDEIDKLIRHTEGRMGFTIGSSLDIFGGGISLEKLINHLKKHNSQS